jgi:hypothetical protein
MNLVRVLLPLACAAICAAADRDPVEVLARFGAAMRENSTRLQGMTCLETIERSYYRAKLAGSPRTCDGLTAEKRRRGYKLELESTDRLHIDVHSGRTEESYSWPGQEGSDGRDLWDLAWSGPAASGSFSKLALQVVQGDAIDFAFLGERDLAGRKLFEYSFRVPVERSHYSIRVGSNDVATSWDGTLLLDAATSDLVRLATRTSELPSGAFACELSTAAYYARQNLLGRELLFPSEARQRFIQLSGVEVESVVTFSSCRAGSRSPGGAPDAASASAAIANTAAKRSLDLPAGLKVQIALDGAIDSNSAGGGDPFSGKVSRPVLDRSSRVVLPEGAVVSGRVLSVAQRVKPPEVAIVLRVESIRIDGTDVPFHLAGVTPPKAAWLWDLLPGLRGGAGGAGAGGFSHTGRVAGGEYNVLTFPGARKTLYPGFKTEWQTIEPSN